MRKTHKSQKSKRKIRVSPTAISSLRPGDIGLVRDPRDPRRIQSYVLPDGMQFSLDNSYLPAYIPSLEPSLMVSNSSIQGHRNTWLTDLGKC